MESPPRLTRAVLARVFWRSFFILAAFTPRQMQALGFTYAIYPGLRRLYPSPGALAEALQRHLGFRFNCHPYIAAAIMGGTLHHEEKIAQGLEPPERANEFKVALMGPLAAIGDGFFWMSLRPALGTAGALLALVFHLYGVVVYFVLYNLIHFILRAKFLKNGYRMGDEVLSTPTLSRLPALGRRLRIFAIACGVAIVARGTTRVPPSLLGVWGSLALGWGIFAVAWWLLKRGLSPYALVYTGTLITVALGAWIL